MIFCGQTGHEELLSVDEIFVLPERLTPNIQGLALEKAHVDYISSGILVDKCLRTTQKNIYALGDVIHGPYRYSHTPSQYYFKSCGFGTARTIRYQAIPECYKPIQP